MPDYTLDTFQNEYLHEGATEVNAIVTVTATNGDGPAFGSAAEATVVIIIDTSGSMAGGRIRAARDATNAAVSVLRDGVRFAVVAGTHVALNVYPRAGTAVASARTRQEASVAIAQLRSDGGTAMSTWLNAAGTLFRGSTGINQAILLTDGENREDPRALPAALKTWAGSFQCHCRGVGTDWRVEELRPIANAMLGTVDIVAQPAGLVDDFTAIVSAAMSKTQADVRLRLWMPAGARLNYLKQVAPDISDLTAKRVEVNARSGDFPTGAWGSESRDYHVSVEVGAGTIGDEMLAARVSLVVGGPDGDNIVGQSLVRAVWTDDLALSTRINKAVAHYTGQAELASVIAEGLEARKAGDVDTATQRFGRAAQIATAAGNQATLDLLDKVVDIEDPATGTVRLKKKVDAADEMALDTRSTRTVRVGKKP
ncbi:vWA domain-containing protein [Smaragdicoccus niigatensis]|uniref:vWA domain-containing protein n=1 Tax=Smaragdicoccus niigatensis TaxID=359359 RepID=UPI0003A64BB4|nr:VWA domain-containing protein [Smaragdicoccus niigatensis]